VIVSFAREQVESGAISINRICQLFAISKATYYAAKAPVENFLSKYEHLKRDVERVIRKNKRYGIRRIKQQLANEKITIGRDVLAKLLNLWGLQLPRKIRKRKPSVIEKILGVLGDRTNLLKRTLITRPLQAVTSDMTILWYAGKKKKAYLCEHKDVFGQMVYGWTVGERMDANLVRSSFKRACKNIRHLCGRLPKLLWHQDRGSQYTSYEYVEDVLQVGALSYSQKGRPTDNPGQESCFGRFKDEWEQEIGELQSFKDVVRFIDKKMRYYNHKRLHTSIGNQTPCAFTKAQLTAQNERRRSGSKVIHNWFRFFRT